MGSFVLNAELFTFRLSRRHSIVGQIMFNYCFMFYVVTDSFHRHGECEEVLPPITIVAAAKKKQVESRNTRRDVGWWRRWREATARAEMGEARQTIH